MKRQTLILMLMMVFCAGGTFAAPKKGIMTDPRDGKTYKTVKIGKQTWMAENLNYWVRDSHCYGDRKIDFPVDAYAVKDSNCAKYGRLYTWNAALKACPTGWHLPSKKEFEVLAKAVGGTLGKDGDRWNDAGKKLKSASSWINNDGKDRSGDDAFGFSALPAGIMQVNEDYGFNGAFFWSSTENLNGFAYFMRFYYDYDEAYIYDNDKNYGFSVRCIKD